MRHFNPLLLAVVLCTACPQSPSSAAGSKLEPMQASDAASDASAHAAHQHYVDAINANNLDDVLGMLTEDVVLMAPDAPPYVGKAAVKPWLEGYIQAYKTHWDKPVQEFVVNGEWAFERYSYTSTDTPIAGGDPVVGTGWGFIVYRHDADGVWRVARDAWGSDKPATSQ